MSITQQTPNQPSISAIQQVELYEGAMCCDTGVCGPSVDEQLLAVREDLRWAETQGASVARHNLTSDPDAFVANPKVTGLMQAFGDKALPVLVIDGEIRAHGHYPTRDELTALLAKGTIAADVPAAEQSSWLRLLGRIELLSVAVAALSELPVLDWSDWPTRHVFFTGKGGVGKTTTASAVGVALATRGRRTLLVSTDPASNLDDVFGIHAGSAPTPVADVPGLQIANIDPEQAAADYRERTLAPYRGVLPDSALASMEEQLSGACTVEIAAFNEFTTILTGAIAAEFDRVLFDTAPTGHTLRLLTLPSAWSGYAQEHPSGASCLGPLAGLDRQRRHYQQAVATLADPNLTRLVLVARADPSALREAARASHELRALGVANQQLVINGLLADPGSDLTARAFCARQQSALAQAPAALQAVPTSTIPLAAGDLTGAPALQRLVTGEPLITNDLRPRGSASRFRDA